MEKQSITITEKALEYLKDKYVTILNKHKEYFDNKSGTQRKSRIEERLKFALEGLK